MKSALQARIANLSAEQRDLLLRKLAKAPAKPAEQPPVLAQPALNPSWLSHSQQRMWLFEKIEGQSRAYNILSALRISGELDPAALEWALNQVIRRHEVLRTRFVEAEGSPRAVVDQEQPLRIELIAAEALRDDVAGLAARVRGLAEIDFRLAEAPLVRVSLLKLAPFEFVLVSVLHHIVADGWSLRLLEQEVSQFYRAHLAGERQPAEPLATQYHQYVTWQRGWLASPAADKQLSYWRKQLEGLPPYLPLPSEQPRDRVAELDAASCIFSLPRELLTALRDLADKERASLFIVLAAAFKLALAHVSGSNDIALGTPVASRREKRYEQVLGLFSNTVVLRSRASFDSSFRAYLDQVKRVALDAFSHQDIPFEQVVDAVRPERSAAYSPLFQVLFALQSSERSALELPGLELEPLQLQRSAIELDLISEFFFDDVSNHFVLSYRTGLYAEGTIQGLICCFLEILRAAASAPDQPLAAVLQSLAASTPAATEARAFSAGAGGLVLRGESENRERSAFVEQRAQRARALCAAKATAPRPVLVCAEDPVDYWLWLLSAMNSGLRVAMIEQDTPFAAAARLLREGAVDALLAPASRLNELAALELSLLDPTAPAQGEAALGPGTIVLPGRTQLAVPVASLQATARFLQTHCPLSSDDRLLLNPCLPAEVNLALAVWALEAGASLEPSAAEAWRAGTPALLRARKPSVAFLRPSQWRELQGDEAATASCRELFVHGEVAKLAAGARPLWRAFSLPETAGPWLLERLSADGTVSVHSRPSLSALNRQGMALPEGIPGELVATLAGAAPIRTGVGGRLRDGHIQVDGTLPASGWLDGQRVDLTAVQQALLALPGVADAALLPRVDSQGVACAVAYVVTAQPVESIPTLIADKLREAELPSAFVPVSRLPWTREGELDTAALLRLPVVDSWLVAEAQAQLAAFPEARVRSERSREAPARIALASAPAAAPAEHAARSAEESTAPSVAVGPPLDTRALPACLSSLLRRAATEHGERGMVYVRDSGSSEQRQSYGELLSEAARVCAGLRAAGLEPGQRALLQLADERDMLTGFWGCVLAGVVPVPVAVPERYEAGDKDVGKILNAWEALALGAVLYGPQAAPGMEPLTSLLGRPAIRILSITELRQHAPADCFHEAAPDHVALLLLTSGSTGKPKAVMQTHGALIARSAATQAQFALDQGVVSFNWMPLDHVGGLVMFHLLDVYLGATQIHCPTRVILTDPLRWLDAMTRHRVTHTWAPNFAYALINERLAEGAERPWDLSKLRFVLNGGEAIVPKTARLFLERLAHFGLSGDAMKPAWGMSETCSGVTFKGDFSVDAIADDAMFAEVGTPIPGVSIRIVDESNRMVPEGRIGRLQIRGPSVTLGYLNNAEATAQSFTEDGWFITGDLAHLRAGSLTITGREKDLIIINGLNYHGHEIEQIVEGVPGIPAAHVAACGVRRADDDTDRLAIFFSLEPDHRATLDEVVRAIRTTMLDKLGIAVSYFIPLAAESLPRTSIGKIQRAQLAERFQAGEFEAHVRTGAGASLQRELPAWFYEPVWVERRGAGALERRAVLVIGAEAGLAGELPAALSAAGTERVVRAVFAEGFTRRGRDLYAIRPSAREDYATLLSVLLRECPGGLHIVHGGACLARVSDPLHGDGFRRAQEPALFSLLALAQAIAGLSADAPPVSLDVVSCAAVAIDDREGADLAVEHAGLSAFLRSVAQEVPHLRCRQIDLDGSEGALAALPRELSDAQKEDVIALRGSRRYVRRLSPLSLPAGPMPLRRFGPGAYLITGGLGGISGLLAESLLRDPGARVLAIGRTPAEQLTRARAAQGGENDDKATRHLRLSRYGERFAYEALDVADGAALEAVITRYEELFRSPLRAAFHLAGVLEEQLIAESSPEALLRAVHGKLLGALALDRALMNRPAVEVFHFGSLNGLFGGLGVAAYAAANGFLDGLARRQRSSGRTVHSLLWSMWDELGMSRGYALKQLTAARGFALLSAQQGLDSLSLAAGRSGSTLAIGLHGENPQLSRYVLGRCQPLLDLSIDGAPPEQLALRDRFGTAVTCRSASAAENAQGAAALDGTIRPFSPLEERLAAVWREVLRTEVSDPQANFFELGGDSILAIQVISRANQQGISLRSRQVFECQTLSALARAAGEASLPQGNQGPVVGPVALGPIQHWFAEHDFRNPHHMNQSVLLTMRERLDVQALNGALRKLLAHHDMLRARYTLSDGAMTQTLIEAAEIETTVVELLEHAHSDYGRAVHGLSSQFQASLNLIEGPAFRAIYLRAAQPEQDRLLLVAHHLVVDGVSWRILLEDLQAAYTQLRSGREPLLPAKTHSYGAWVEEWRGFAASSAAEPAAEAWRELCGAATVLPRTGDGENLRSRERSCEITLDAHTTSLLLQSAPRAHAAEIDDILLSALCRAYRAWCGSDELYLTLEGHGRHTRSDRLDVSRTVGWFTALFPLRLRTSAEATWPELVASVRHTRRALPEHGVAFGVLRYLGSAETRARLGSVAWPSLSFNYLGRFDGAGDGDFAFAPESPGEQQDPADLRVNELDIVGRALGGELSFSFIYADGRFTAEAIGDFAERFRALLVELARGASTAAGPATVAAVDVEAELPITPMQQGLLFDSMHAGAKGVYVSQLINELVGELSVSSLRWAWEQVVQRHGAYRTGFADLEGPSPRQVVYRVVDLPFFEHDYRAEPPEARERLFDELVRSEREQGFDPATAPLLRIHLIRLEDARHRMLISEHHAISDGWSRSIVLRELAELYRARLRGEPSPAAKAPSYAGYVAWLERYDHERAAEYWRAHLHGVGESLPLASERRSPGKDKSSGRLYRRMDLGLSQRLMALTKARRVTASAFTQAAWATLLSLQTGSDDVVFGTTHAGRPAELADVESIVGLFINTVPVRIQLRADEPAIECAKGLQRLHLDRTEHGHLPLTAIKRLSGLSPSKPLFESLFLFENFPLTVPEPEPDGLHVEWVKSLDDTGHPLMVMVVPVAGKELEIIAYYREDRFTAEAVEGLLTSFESILAQLVAFPDRPLKALDWLTDSQRRQVLDDWNGTAKTYPGPDRLDGLLATQVARDPAKTALIFGNSVLSYGELERRAEELAIVLRQNGVAQESVVGIMLDRSLELVVALLAVWKAGAGYLPLDPTYPRSRLEYMLDNSGARVVLTESRLRPLLTVAQTTAVLCLDALPALEASASVAPDGPSGSNLAYLMYTSGSTGAPKGIQVEHASVANFLHAMQECFPLTERDVLLAITSISFDISVLELFLPLMRGATVVIAGRDEAHDPGVLRQLIRRHGVSLMQATPATWQMLFDDGFCNEEQIVMLTGGDVLTEGLAQRMAGVGKVWNLYGPTEATVWCSAKAITADDSRVTLGRPIANLRCYVLDGCGRLLPEGVPGELYVAGTGVARGYFGQESLTAERFVPDTIVPERGERMYRTGDQVRFLPSGELEFLGRLDNQVKIRGFRVELGEIERVLAAVAEVRGVVVKAWGEGPSEKSLVAYVVADGPVDELALRKQAGALLPSYMHPSFYVLLSSFPLTHNGKIDRKALPAPELRPAVAPAADREATPLEQALMEIWKPLLNITTLTPSANFFDLGGNSILAAQLSSRIRRQFAVDVPVMEIFDATSLAAMAERITSLGGLTAEAGDHDASDEETIEF